MDSTTTKRKSLEEIINSSGNSIRNHSENPNSVSTPPKEGSQNFLSGWKLFTILTCLCMCEFLVALDATILATAIPVISHEFQALEDIGWYVSAYFLTNCAFQLVYGKFYSMFAVKPIYMTAVGIFELGSLICAVARDTEVFIFGRAVAGLGAAGIFSGGTSTLFSSSDRLLPHMDANIPRQRSFAFPASSAPISGLGSLA
jgi:MFS family permease